MRTPIVVGRKAAAKHRQRDKRSHAAPIADLFEAPARAAGRLCGVDEAGRGPLAGPVIAAAVILDPARPIAGLRDSKLLSPARREALVPLIKAHSIAWAVAAASVEEIDRLNILQASLLAMGRAVDALDPQAQFALIDGNQVPRLAIGARAIVGGDRGEPAISAASILAKTHRDALLRALHRDFPHYGFDLHFGYPTPLHLQRLRAIGPCSEHRRSFAPVAACLAPPDASPSDGDRAT